MCSCATLTTCSLWRSRAKNIAGNKFQKVDQLIAEEVDGFVNWMKGIPTEAIIAALRAKSEDIRLNELARLESLLENVDATVWSRIDRFSKSLVNKLFHEPTTQLRRLSNCGDGVDLGNTISKLFRLSLRNDVVPDVFVAPDVSASAPSSRATDKDLQASTEPHPNYVIHDA